VLFDPKLELMAKDGNEMPDGLEYPDQIMYLCLRMLYAQLRQGVIDRDTAIREKKKLLREYEAYLFVDQMGKEWVQVIKNTELARADYMKNRTLENADKLIAKICPAGRKEKHERK
jgi:hypothetical protein